MPTRCVLVFGRPISVDVSGDGDDGAAGEAKAEEEVKDGKNAAAGAAKPNPSPSDAQVERVFERYKAEMTRLFDAYKDRLPPAVAKKGLMITNREV